MTIIQFQWKNADSQLTAKEVDTVLDWAQVRNEQKFNFNQ